VTDTLASFGKPFAWQVAAYRLRLGKLVGTTAWDDLKGAEHDRAFMVAGAMKAELLADLAAAVDKAVSQGTSLAEFRRDFRDIVEKNGWHGWTGEGTKRGEAWRTKVIYKTNLATSYAAGRMAQLKASGFAFWVYSHGNALEPRIEHLGWDGLVLEPDHPFWATHAPPNGWGCSCFISGARSKAGAARGGADPEKSLPEGWQARDPRTGAPVGISKGWDHAPGASVTDLVAALAPKVEALPRQPSIDLIQSWLTMDSFARWMSAPKGFWPVARVPDAAASAIASKVTVANLSPETMAKQLREHPELTALDYLMIQRTVDLAKIRVQDTPTSMIFVFEDPEAAGYVLVVKATRSGEGLYVTSFRRLSSRDVDRDRVVRALIAKEKK
jgi:hypothetical protein